jgi:NAD+ synthetase
MPGTIAPRLAPEAEVYKALVLGLRDYVIKNGFPGVVLGVSGEIESALTLAIAVDALGPSRVRAVMMPSQHTLPRGRDDARAQALAMGARYSEIAIGELATAYHGALSTEVSSRRGATHGRSLCARIRGTLLMALSKETGAIVLASANKSDMATGAATLQGDMAGGFAVLKDIDKRLVHALADYRNGVSRVIPQTVIDRAPPRPTAGESEYDALPPYPILDAILEAYVEDELAPAQIIARGYAPADVERVLQLVQSSEYKRRQAPIGVRITGRAFGKDWRYPITNRFRHCF